MGEALFLEITSPLPEEGDDVVVVSTATVVIEGRTRVDAAVTINDQFVEVDENGKLQLTVTLQEGINVFEVVASVATGEEQSLILIVSFEPEEES